MKKFILKLVLVLMAFSPVFAERPVYVGAKKCKGCHVGPKNGKVYEKWGNAVHARAFQTLKAKGEEKNPRCLYCHVTGFNDGGYKIGAPNAADFEGVQCESCHGKGSLYKKASIMKRVDLAVESGMIIPMESLCTKCHNEDSPTFKGFNYNEAVKVITHIFTDKPVRTTY